MAREENPSNTKSRNWLYWVRVKSKNVIRYVAMLVVVISVWHFFAPFISIPVWPTYQSLMPNEAVAVGQEPRAIINIGYLLPMVIGGIIAWKL